MTEDESRPVGDGDYSEAARRIMARSALQQGAMADQLAGDAAAEAGLRRTRALTDALGRPQDELTIVHVAGTKGKGSTVAFISSILVAGGIRTGRLTSPHLEKLTERITVDERDIDDRAFAAVAGRVLAAAETLERDRPDLGPVNALELLFAMGLVAFRDAGCQVAVVEVGIGGRLDTTNIVRPAVSVITTLDLEHTAILGETLAAIAAEKAGIIKPGRPVVVAPQPEEALAVIREQATKLGSRLYLVDDGDGAVPGAVIGLAGPHQATNAALALAAVRELGAVDPRFAIPPDVARSAVSRTWLPGRFERVAPDAIARFAGSDTSRAHPAVVLDGAHTPKAASALRATLDAMVEPTGEVVAVCGSATDKDVRGFLAALRPTRILPVVAASLRAIPAIRIAEIAAGLGIGVIDGPEAVADGLRWVLRSEARSGTVVVTGSFVVVAEARLALGLPPFRQ